MVEIPNAIKVEKWTKNFPRHWVNKKTVYEYMKYVVWLYINIIHKQEQVLGS